MNSAKGTKTVRLQRTKTGLDFSVKGGKEHGIPIVVSWILETSPAAKHLRLGDEILAVNGQPLQGMPHAQAVHYLRTAGPTVVLRVRPNQMLEDVFSGGRRPSSALPSPTEEEEEYNPMSSLPSTPTLHSGPLPQGWGQKTDHRTGRPYFENHYTQTTGWTDPRSLTPQPLNEFQWNALPPGWERFLDDQGDIYYVCHDTQTTHWDSPRGLRQQRQLSELKPFLQQHKDKLKSEEDDLKHKRELLLSKNKQLDTFGQEEPPQSEEKPKDIEEDEEQEVGNSPADLIDDIMLLNEEVEIQDAHVTSTRKKLQNLADILRQAQFEDIGQKDEHAAGAELAHELLVNFDKLKSLEEKLFKIVKSLGELQRRRDPTATPLHYMLQVPPSQSSAELEERARWLHALPDRLTGKTNCEMRLELLLLKECYRYGVALQKRLTAFYNKAMVAHGGWELLMEELAGCDFTPLQDTWLRAEFREKLEKSVTF